MQRYSNQHVFPIALSLLLSVVERQLAAADCGVFLSPLMKPDTNVIAARGRTSRLMLWTAAGH